MSSRLGLRRKTLLGIAEERGGRRGPGNAIANTGVATVAALLARIDVPPRRSRSWPSSPPWRPAAATRSPARSARRGAVARISCPTFRRVPPGTSGAMSLEGTARGRGRRRSFSARSAAAARADSRTRARGGRRRGDGRLARRKPARRDSRGSGYPEQRHAELPQHRDRRGRRDSRCGTGGVNGNVARLTVVRVLAPVHARRAGARLRVRRRHGRRRSAARSLERRPHPLSRLSA